MYRNFGVDGDLVATPSQTIPYGTPNARRPRWFLPADDDNEKLLRLAKTLISDGHWCQGRFATNANDEQVDELDDTAQNFCVVGAIRRANHLLPAPRFFACFWRHRRYEEAIRIMCTVVDRRAIEIRETVSWSLAAMAWNDGHSYGEVLAALNRAILVAPCVEVM